MTTGTAVSVEEYLRTSYEPNCEYVDGVLVTKAMPTRKHSRIQGQLIRLIDSAFPRYEALAELTVRITGRQYRVPDVAVELRENGEDPYPITPVHLCIEIVSPDDRVSELIEKCKVYHAWGVPHAWVIDPQTLQAWRYAKGSTPVEIASGAELTAGEIRLRVSDIFAVL